MKKTVQVFEGLAIFLFMQALGEFITRATHLILPGNLTGLLLLFLSLVLGIVKLEQVEDAANLLLDNMMSFFIPLNVGLITILPLLKKEGMQVLITLLATTVLVMVVTAKVIEFMDKGGTAGDADKGNA
ncbi:MULTISPECIES: CidA/LrgA family protein [Thermincola]|uniref:CidA/LrgA family protein n=1 Tax=Thermincola TaxID=278993 RepID=UPI0002FC6C78|nr:MULTISPECIES: CidA/LrgA family protein [Thermincola]